MNNVNVNKKFGALECSHCSLSMQGHALKKSRISLYALYNVKALHSVISDAFT